MRFSTSTLIISALTLMLASCASVPQQDNLLAGIDTSKLSAQAPTTKRATSDPVCTEFYNNVNTFEKQAQKAKGGKNFLASMGLNVVAAVATQGIVPAGIGSTAGRVAAYSAASSVTSQGTRIALRQLNSSDRADAKIIDVANQIGCPVSIKP